MATALAWVPVVPVSVRFRAPQLASLPAGSWSGNRLDSRQTAGVPHGIGWFGALMSRAVLGALLVTLVARGIASGRPPLADLWEFTVAFAAAVSAFQLAFSRKTGSPNADVALNPLVLFLLVVAAFLPSRIEPLAPSLRSGNILVAHVTVMVVAYGALTVSFAAALLQLWQTTGLRLSRLPDSRAFEAIAYRAVVVGFPLLTLGIALGAYWASKAWGRYWGWDPKETSALITWLAYGVYFHLHSLRSWAGRRSAIVLVVAYGCVLFSYFGVNLWIAGLHSYARG
jgi:cytochrome c-type biogenesis protein CcsB